MCTVFSTCVPASLSRATLTVPCMYGHLRALRSATSLNTLTRLVRDCSVTSFTYIHSFFKAQQRVFCITCDRTLIRV
jgi:hypothetical protein